MEIRDYLRAIRRWLWLPVVLPLVAAALTGLLLERQPSQYQANATVIVPAVSAKGFSSSAASQYVATFKDVLISQPVVDKVSKATHVPAKDLVNGLSASTISTSSNIIHVVFLGTKGENATQVVRLATVDTLDAVAQPQLMQAQNSVAAAQGQLQQANAAITQWTATTGLILPQQQFTTQQQELNQLLLQLQQAHLANDTAHAAALQAVISQRQGQLATLATQVTQYTDLSDARQSALSVRDHSAQELANAQALLSADHNPGTVTVQDIGRISKLSNTLKFAAIAFAVALILALAFILLLELMRGGRVQTAQVAPVGLPEADLAGRSRASTPSPDEIAVAHSVERGRVHTAQTAPADLPEAGVAGSRVSTPSPGDIALAHSGEESRPPKPMGRPGQSYGTGSGSSQHGPTGAPFDAVTKSRR
jgi:capsular polysaccharide biosynthesis protein